MSTFNKEFKSETCTVRPYTLCKFVRIRVCGAKLPVTSPHDEVNGRKKNKIMCVKESNQICQICVWNLNLKRKVIGNQVRKIWLLNLPNTPGESQMFTSFLSCLRSLNYSSISSYTSNTSNINNFLQVIM
jgi:hypothetical protein